MEKNFDEEIIVSDLEYISANIVEGGNNDKITIPQSSLTIPSEVISKFGFEIESDGTSSSSESEDDVIITSTNEPAPFKVLKKEPHKKCSVNNLSFPREDGELSSENEHNFESNVDINFTNFSVEDSFHCLNEVKLDKNTKIVNFGSVINILDNSMVVKARPNVKIVDVGTSIFLEDKSHIGEIYDLFGKIELPFYSVSLKKTVMPLIREGLNVYYAESGDNVVFVEFDKINRIDDGIESGSETECNDDPSKLNLKPSSINNKKNPSRKRNNKQKNLHENDNHQTYMNAWPPSMKTLRNSYDVRTFYKYGQWPNASNLLNKNNANEKRIGNPLPKK